MAEAHVLPASKPPSLKGISNRKDRIQAIIDWFFANYDDPANSLPYESKEGGYQWIWGGPYDASEEISDAFADEDEFEVAEAIEAVIERNDVQEWTISSNRIASIDPDGDDEDAEYPDFDPAEDEFDHRFMPPEADRRAYTVVETVLFPRRAYDWTVHATFIPGRTNLILGAELESVTDAADPSEGRGGQEEAYHGERREFSSLRLLVKTLIDLELEGRRSGELSDLESSRDWIDHLSVDSDLFVDDSIIVHGSPPAWFPLAKAFAEGGGASVIILQSNSVGQAAAYLALYSGARVVIRVAHGGGFLVDAFVERLGNRIRRGDFDNGASDRQFRKPIK